MARKRASVSRPMLFTWLMLASWILFLAPQRATDKFHFAFVRLFRPLLSAGSRISRPAFGNPKTVSRHKFIEMENHAANLSAQLQEARRKYEELSGLRARFGLENAAVVLADVITATTDPTRHELIINRGRLDGLAKGQFVLCHNSVVGVISNISSTEATVKLITDPGCKLHAKIAVSDVYIHSIMIGNGKSGAKIRSRYRANKADYVYAAKQPGLLDTLIIVGKVVQCRPDDANPLLWDITVEPASDMHSLQTVAVIVMNPQNTTD